MKKLVIVALVMTCVLAVPFMLSGCSSSNGSTSSNVENSQNAQEPERPTFQGTPGEVDFDHLKAGLKYYLDTKGANYDGIAMAFENEGTVFREDDGKTMAYEWNSKDPNNTVVVTFETSNGRPDACTGMSWSGDEIREYRNSLE